MKKILLVLITLISMNVFSQPYTASGSIGAVQINIAGNINATPLLNMGYYGLSAKGNTYSNGDKFGLLIDSLDDTKGFRGGCLVGNNYRNDLALVGPMHLLVGGPIDTFGSGVYFADSSRNLSIMMTHKVGSIMTCDWYNYRDIDTVIFHMRFDSILTIETTVKIQDGTQGIGKIYTSDADGLGSWQDPSSNMCYNTTAQDYYMGIFNASIFSIDPYVYPQVTRNFSKISMDSVNHDLVLTATPISLSIPNIYNHVMVVMPFYDSVTVYPSTNVHFDPITGVAGKTGTLNLVYDARKQAYIEDTPFKMTY